MQFTRSLTAELAALTAALDEPGVDIGQNLHLLEAAESSFLGMSVVVKRHDSSFTAHLLSEDCVLGDIGASIVISLPTSGNGDQQPAVAFIHYAQTPVAFIDLAADIAWLTGCPATDFVLDEPLVPPVADSSDTPLATESAINQAIGVLLGRGYTTQQAHWELDTQAAHTGTYRQSTARRFLARLTPGGDNLFDIY